MPSQDDLMKGILGGHPAIELRLIAAEIIWRLWRAGETAQLGLLKAAVDLTLTEPYKGEGENGSRIGLP